MRIRPVIVSALVLLVMCPGYSQTKEYLLEIKNDKKILNIANLDLPSSTTVSELLEIFPELLSRDGDRALSNYDVQINGISSGVNRDNVLKQYKLGDLQTIEVSTNPSMSEQKNAQGGVINLKYQTLDEGFSGNAALYVSSLVDVMPGVKLNWKKNNWTFRGALMMEYYSPYNELSRRETHYQDYSQYISDTSHIHKGHQHLNIDVEYKKDRSTLRLWAMENLMLDYNRKQSSSEINSITTATSSNENDKSISCLAGLKYEYAAPIVKFETEWTASYTPDRYTLQKYVAGSSGDFKTWDLETKNRNQSYSGLAKGTFHLVPTDSEAKVDLVGGVNASYGPSYYSHDFTTVPSNSISQEIPQDDHIYSLYSTLYLSPFIETDNAFGKWTLKGGLRYQRYISDMDVNGSDSFSRNEGYLTGSLILGYQLARHHHLNLTLDRQIRRMSSYQVYPYKLYSPSLDYFTQGNPDLLPAIIHNVGLNYITDFKIDDKFFTFDTELKYVGTDRIVRPIKTAESITYDNDKSSNILTANLLFFFSYRILSMSLSANYFNNWIETAGVKEKCNYYNISFVPKLSFPSGWNASVKFTYNSHIYSNTSRLSDYFYAATRFAKSWEKVTAYLQMGDNFHSQANDILFGKALKEVLYYNLHRPSLELGCFYKF